MSLKFAVEDNASQGLDALQARFSEEKRTVLQEMMFAATGRPGDTKAPIARRLMEDGMGLPGRYSYNPWLFRSGQDTSFWTFDLNDDESFVLANYSGMRGYRELDEFKVWIEFDEEYGGDNYWEIYKKDPYDRELDRDYAFYQETGVDKYASPADAHHIGFVSKGLEEASQQAISQRLKSEMGRILNAL